jgi:endogenous inhibitor of DNA gyrase (YacG/DUF329 family)
MCHTKKIKDMPCSNAYCGRMAYINFEGKTPLCNRHYQMAYNGKDWRVKDKEKKKYDKCQFEGCDKKVRSTYAMHCEGHYAQIRRNGHAKPLKNDKECGYCGESTDNKKYCSPRCASRALRGVAKEKFCKHCGKSIALDGTNRVSCSEYCKQEVLRKWAKRSYEKRFKNGKGQNLSRKQSYEKRAKKHGVKIVDFDPNEIFIRDNWICHVCKKKVDNETSWPSPDYPTLDHIKPMSLGGDHSPENVACCHLSCNISKGSSYSGASLSKAKRQAGETGQYARRMKAKKSGKGHKWPSPKIPSRPFQRKPR